MWRLKSIFLWRFDSSHQNGVPLSLEPRRTLSAVGPEECVRRVGLRISHSQIQFDSILRGSFLPQVLSKLRSLFTLPAEQAALRELPGNRRF
jgi:hypothetical protein